MHDPYPLPVRWRTTSTDVADHWANIRNAPPGVEPGPLALDGGLEEIGDVYRRVPSGRVVFLGEAGSGKTILAVRLVLSLLESRAPGGPVPVLFGLGTWDPGRTSFRDWMVGQLVRDHPGLGPPGRGRTSLAVSLVAAGCILPVLDGFDEIADGHHDAALKALNTTAEPMVVTSRVAEFTDAVRAADVLTSAAVVTVDPLDIDDLAEYLPRTARGAKWAEVLLHLRANPDDPLGTVLRTPLMVGLARAVYSDSPDRDPALLLRSADRRELEQALLREFIPASYGHPVADAGTPHVKKWEIGDARRWLTVLATHMEVRGNGDLSWWKLRHLVPGWQRGVIVGAVISILSSVVNGVVTTILTNSPHGFVKGFGNIFVFAFPAILSVIVLGWRLEPYRLQLGVLTRMRRGFKRALFTALLVCPVVIFGYGSMRPAERFGAGISMGIFGVLSSDRMAKSWRPGHLARCLRMHGARGARFLVASALCGLLAGVWLMAKSGNILVFTASVSGFFWYFVILSVGSLECPPTPTPRSSLFRAVLATGETGRQVRIGAFGMLSMIFMLLGDGASRIFRGGFRFTPGVSVVYVLLIISGLGGLVALLYSAVSSLGVPATVREMVTPAKLIRTDRRYTLFVASVTGSLLGLCWMGIVMVGAGRADGTGVGLVLGATFALMFAFAGTAWGQWLVVCRFWLPLTGKLPWALPHFLADAHRRGVLRQVGAVYQFRHLRLQESLASNGNGPASQATGSPVRSP
ncbi:NACHT domain-containing protein [Actinosynnema sp. NPDC020468]|uniref:NACHT domain-containing protein n=1 Tax=Actinosynnema sp. NPDC020468 TaxID=3154488 RepID=UPI0033FC5973